MLTLTTTDFAAARFPIALDAGELHLWFFPPDTSAPAPLRVRRLLAAYLRCAPDDLVMQRAEYGKPYLVQPVGLEFNLSHSRHALLVGLSRRQALGVDIETTQRERPVLELARRFFTANESAALSRLNGALAQQAFLRLWSAKEAVVKALGRGLGFGLAALEFDIDRDGRPTRLNVISASAGAAQEWQIIALRPSASFVGTVAWRGPARVVRAFRAGDD